MSSGNGAVRATWVSAAPHRFKHSTLLEYCPVSSRVVRRKAQGDGGYGAQRRLHRVVRSQV